MSKILIICESHAKAKTISSFLGNEYIVKASFGHISDLPKKNLGFDPDNNFKPKFSVTNDKIKTVKELISLIKRGTEVYLATDEDREGEAIAHHLIQVLKLQKANYKRIVFHEITKTAILKAIANPIELNEHLVDAAITRRLLDRTIGYKLSPVLWKKIKYGLSAGRTQSVAVRILADREKLIREFIPEAYFNIDLRVNTTPSFKARLVNKDKRRVTNIEEVNKIVSDCKEFVLTSTNQVNYRQPPPPFITSTLQQVSSSKLHLSAKQTMMIAQRLYEGGIKVPDHKGGLITYMRTDSVTLSQFALDSIKRTISNLYGDEYVIDKPRLYKNKVKGAQEAHEAIRPTDMSITPEVIKSYVDDKTYKLYKIIWSRTMATQMTAAKRSVTKYNILGGGKYTFTAKGVRILFDGFLRVYNTEDDNQLLPHVEDGVITHSTTIEHTATATKPPARYKEASLIQFLESEGIGRPATYASTISTIIDRGYVEKLKDRSLATTTTGETVNQYLVTNFPDIVDVHFTSNLELLLDKIAHKQLTGVEVLREFYDKLMLDINDNQDIKVSFTDKLLGVTPNNEPIYLKTNLNGNYLQLGDKVEGVKNRTASIPKDTIDISVVEAIKLLSLPKVLGKINNMDIIAKQGKFGPYLQVGKSFYTVKDDDIYTIEYDRAVEIIKNIQQEKEKAIWWSNSTKTLQVIDGKYGLYLSDSRTKKRQNYKIKGYNSKSKEDMKNLKVEDILKYVKVKKNRKRT